MSPPERVDLHVHSTASDGTWTPAEVVQQAAAVGVTTLALTDHDSTAGIEAARAGDASQQRIVKVLPGVEVTTYQGGVECHLLGYLEDPADPRLQSFLAERRRARRRRAAEMLSRLRALGCSLSLKGWEPEGEREGEPAWGRPHLAAELVAQGLVSSLEEAFRRYLGRGGPAYVPPERFPPEEGLSRLQACGAVVVLAHPVLHQAERLLPRLVDQGLEGLECFHPQHSPPVVDYFLHQARRYGLVATGGSDSHGPQRPGLGAVDVPWEAVEHLVRAWEGL